MSEPSPACREFEQWLATEAAASDPPAGENRAAHAERCAECSRQWRAHRLLVAAFAGEVVPRLSPGFEAGLERKLVSSRRAARPLTGWRRTVLVGYGLAALGLLGGALRQAPLPAVDASAPWLAVAALAAVPLSLGLAIGVSRWLPAPRAGGGAPLTL